jgi:synaptotagmin-14/16
VCGGDGDFVENGIETDENLFDVGDLQLDREPMLISKCGELRVTFHYQITPGSSSSGSRMVVTVHEAKDLPTKDRGGAQYTQVRLLLLPTRKTRHKTKIRSGDDNPKFEETFSFKVPAEELASMGLRLRIYGCERMKRERMIGETVVGFASLVGALDYPFEQWLTLEPRSNLSHGDSKTDIVSLSRSDSGSSGQSMLQHGGMPELMIGLAYNGMTGRLSVQVIKGSNFKNMAMSRAPDTYVKLTLMSPNGQEITRSKTSVRRGQPNPLYKETFMFQVALFQLPDVTLMVSVFYNRSIKRKEMIGWFSLGYTNSSDEEQAHWAEMRESNGEEICRWHVLLEP